MNFIVKYDLFGNFKIAIITDYSTATITSFFVIAKDNTSFLSIYH